MAEVARQQGVKTAVGVQAAPILAIIHLRNLVADGYVGRVMACHVRLMREGVLSRVSGRTWQRDVELGANTLTIACGHTIDALCSVVGEFADVATVVSTQAPTWHETDTGKDLPVTSPDNILVSGNLQGGGVASVHIGSIPWAGSGYRMEVYGEEGTLVAVSLDSAQLQEVRIRGARGGSNDLEDLTPPAELHLAPDIPGGSPYNVGQLYSQFAASIHGTSPRGSAQCPRLRPRRRPAPPNRRHPAVERRGPACGGGVKRPKTVGQDPSLAGRVGSTGRSRLPGDWRRTYIFYERM